MRHLLAPLALLGCTTTEVVDAPVVPPPDTADTDTGPVAPVDPFAAFPDPAAWGPRAGPGIGARTFAEDELFTACAYLSGDPARESDHHNLVVMYDGYVVMPWAPEWGPQRTAFEDCGLAGVSTPESPGAVADCPGAFGGGITVFDLSDPCAPTKVGEAWTPWMRESHALGFNVVDGRTYVAVDFLAYDGSGGVGFFDLTDPSAPAFVSWVRVPGHRYPDSYLLLTLSVFWQGRYVYASSAGHGVFVIDALDPLRPEVVDTDPDVAGVQAFKLQGEGIHHGGTFHVWGNRALASAAGIESTFLVDLGDPTRAEVFPGGSFAPTTADGKAVGYYFANLGSRYGLFARSDGGGGPVVVDVVDPSAPTRVAGLFQPDGDGGYVFQHEDLLFQGESNYGAVYDFDGATITERGRFQLAGDLDTVTPLGHLAVVAVDEKAAAPGQATAIMPWTTTPDARAPRPGMHSPEDGATNQPLTTRVGIVFDEMIEPVSAFPGSVRLARADGAAVDAWIQVQENIVNLSPKAPLDPDTTYWVQVPAGGLIDLAGNPVAETVTWSFTTAP